VGRKFGAFGFWIADNNTKHCVSLSVFVQFSSRGIDVVIAWHAERLDWLVDWVSKVSQQGTSERGYSRPKQLHPTSRNIILPTGALLNDRPGNHVPEFM
jgi:hypothetical protein